MKKVSLLKKALTYWRLGLKSLLQVGLHRCRLKSGWYQRKTPIVSWHDIRQGGSSPWPERLVLPSDIYDRKGLIDSVKRMSSGELLYFGKRWRTCNQSWARNWESGYIFPRLHWSSYSQQSGGKAGDLKLVWEPNRCDWAITLLRADSAGIPDAKRVFQELFKSWQDSHLPNEGVAWLCAQEVSLRILNLMRCSRLFEDSSVLWGLAVISAQRIVPSIDYALAQNNNHAISEAVALHAIGCAVQDHPDSAHWRSIGTSLLSRLCENQFQADGGYVQHSLNYQRMAVWLIINYIVIAEHFGESVAPVIRNRLSAAWRFLYSHQDEQTGRVPNYGANDGANPCSINGLDYLDYRPVLAAAAWITEKIRLYPPGPWDEQAIWLAGEDFTQAEVLPVLRKNEAFGTSGHFVIREGNSFAMMRCHSYKVRPSQSDSLHVDLWIDGRNILRDAGTWRYWHASGEQEFFGSTSAHNTLEVNGRSHMPKISTFLFADWAQDKIVEIDFEANQPIVVGETNAYRGEGVRHRRTLQKSLGSWLIKDEILGSSATCSGVLRWRLDPDQSWTLEGKRCYSDKIEIQVDGPGVLELISVEEQSSESWESLYYDDRQRVPLLVLRVALGGVTVCATKVNRVKEGNCS